MAQIKNDDKYYNDVCKTEECEIIVRYLVGAVKSACSSSRIVVSLMFSPKRTDWGDRIELQNVPTPDRMLVLVGNTGT